MGGPGLPPEGEWDLELHSAPGVGLPWVYVQSGGAEAERLSHRRALGEMACMAVGHSGCSETAVVWERELPLVQELRLSASLHS